MLQWRFEVRGREENMDRIYKMNMIETRAGGRRFLA